MEEDVVGKYEKLLEQTTNPGVVLANFYSELFNIKLKPGHYQAINKFINLYGRDRVFLAILKMVHWSNLDHSKLYNILRYILEEMLEKKKIKTPDYKDTMNKINDIKKEIKKLKK